MKVIGLIGGMSWESSAEYYRLVNQMVKAHLGGFHSCECLMYSVDFAVIEQLQMEGNWSAMDQIMAKAAQQLEKGGAELIVLCTNTMHLCSPAIRAAVDIPLLHIAEATSEAIVEQGLNKVGLLGTRFTMEKDFYRQVLQDQFGIQVLVPDQADREIIHQIIYDELVQGIIKDDSRKKYQLIIDKLQREGAQGVVLGCTEIPLLIKASDVTLTIFDTTFLHAQKAVEWALEPSKIELPNAG